MKVSPFLIAICSLLTAGCDGYSSIERQGMERVNEQLFDPSSAEFRNVHEGTQRTGGWIVCGEVNGKNRMGGYTGFRKFATTEKHDDVMFEDSETVEGALAAALIPGLCKFPQKA